MLMNLGRPRARTAAAFASSLAKLSFRAQQGHQAATATGGFMGSLHSIPKSQICLTAAIQPSNSNGFAMKVLAPIANAISIAPL